jgi:transcriptional regulator with XRE-family HTH domain
MKREWLKTARKEKGHTLKSLAEAVGCSFNYISDLENGRRTPSLKTAFKLSEILDFDILNFIEKEQQSA